MMECYKTLHINAFMIQLHFGVNQMKIGESMGILHSFAQNYVKYANMEGFCRDMQSHI